MPQVTLVGEAGAGKTCLAAIFYAAALDLARKDSKFGLEPDPVTVALLSRTLTVLRRGTPGQEWPAANLFDEEHQLDFVMRFGRTRRRLTIRDLPGGSIREIRKSLVAVGSQRVDIAEIVQELADGHPVLRNLFATDVIMVVIDAQRAVTKAALDDDDSYAMYLGTMREFQRTLQQRPRALFVVLSKFDTVESVFPEKSSEAMKQGISRYLPNTHNELQTWERSICKLVTYIPTWIKCNGLIPKIPLEYSEDELQYLIQVLGRL